MPVSVVGKIINQLFIIKVPIQKSPLTVIYALILHIMTAAVNMLTRFPMNILHLEPLDDTQIRGGYSCHLR